MIQRLISLACLITLLFGCSAAEKKVYPSMPSIPAAIDVESIWVASVGARSRYELRQLPVTINDGDIYVAYAGGEVGALGINHGHLQWRVNIKGKISSGPAVGQGLVVITTENAELIALDQANGKERWHIALPSVVLSRPLITKDRMYVQANDEKLYALNIKDGSKLWVQSSEAPPLSLRGTATPVLVDGKVITGYANGQLVAYDAVTGSTLWDTTISVPHGRSDLERIVDIDGLLATNDHMVYATTYQGHIAAVSSDDGRMLWNREMSSYQGVTLDKKQLYISDAEGYVWALDRKTGATLWRQEKLKDRDISAPRVMNNAVVVADGGGYVHWLSKDDGGFIARKSLKRLHEDVFVDWGDVDFNSLDYGVSTNPAVIGDLAIVRNNNGDLALFRVWPKGAHKQKHSWLGPFASLFSAH